MARLPEALGEYFHEVYTNVKKILVGSAFLAVLGIIAEFTRFHPAAYVFWILAVLSFSVGQYKAYENMRQGKISEIDAFRRESEDLKAQIAELKKEELPTELVEESHARELKGTLREIIAEINANKPMSINTHADRPPMLAHFPVVAAELDRWNKAATMRGVIEKTIDDKFENRIGVLSFTRSGFSREGLDHLLEQVKSEAMTGHLAAGSEIDWYPQDSANPDDLRLASGQFIITASRSEPSLVLQTCKIRLNEFVRDMRQWPEIDIYGDRESLEEYHHARESLLKTLEERRTQHSYYRSKDCPHCPQR